MNFDSHVNGIVLLSAQLVNVATPGMRQGRPYAVPRPGELSPLVGTALAAGSRRADAPAPNRTRHFVQVAEAARPAFESADIKQFDAAAAIANGLLARYAPAPRLEQHDGEPWHLHFHGPAQRDPSGWGGAVAMGLATVLGSDHADRLGVCAAPGCDRVFVDVSRNGTRRFCSETCQNRVKAATHRARQRG